MKKIGGSNMNIDFSVFLTFGGALILIFLLGKALIVPLKAVLKIIFNSIIGAVVLVVLNLVGSRFGLILPINVLNAFIVGILGIPGVIVLIIFCN
jgi:inhibitor of the pro-sigma K processing machinery